MRHRVTTYGGRGDSSSCDRGDSSSCDRGAGCESSCHNRREEGSPPAIIEGEEGSPPAIIEGEEGSRPVIIKGEEGVLLP
jgi:hypothetical protein